MLSEKNMDTLSAESERLQDHSKRACKCWMWMMIGLVMVIFICEYIYATILLN
jgi:unconventional SNARE in the endoplasmic reticulum protein 1